MTQRYCKKCLLRDMPEGEYFKNLYEYIAGLPQEDKVSDDVYESRLEQCKRCENLLNGMCRLCGCYVENAGSHEGAFLSPCPRVMDSPGMPDTGGL